MDEFQSGETRSDMAEKIGKITGQAKSFVREQLDKQLRTWGNEVQTAADGIRGASREMRGSGNAIAAGFVEGMADRTELVADYLARTDMQRLMEDAGDFARRKPWVVASIGLLLGFTVTRMLKAANGRSVPEKQHYTQAQYDERLMANEGPMTAYGSP